MTLALLDLYCCQGGASRGYEDAGFEVFGVDIHEYDRDTLALLVKELGGRDLACWCPLNHPCHADVLLEMAAANALVTDERTEK